MRNETIQGEKVGNALPLGSDYANHWWESISEGSDDANHRWENISEGSDDANHRWENVSEGADWFNHWWLGIYDVAVGPGRDWRTDYKAGGYCTKSLRSSSVIVRAVLVPSRKESARSRFVL